MKLSIDEIELKKQNGKNYLYCEKKISSSYGIEYVLFLLEQSSLSPALPVFSTLRNKFIDVNNLVDVEKVIAEDIKYKEIVDAFLHDTPRMQAKKILLRAFTKCPKEK